MLATIAHLRIPVIARVRLGVVSLRGSHGAALGMPALVLKPHEVLDALHEQAVHYANPSTMSPDAVPKPSLLVQTFEPYELGLVLPIVGIVGLAILLGRRETRRVVIPWILFGVALVPVLSFPFQPFRNVLALVPLMIIAAAIVYDSLSRLGRVGALGGAFLAFILVASFVPGLFLVFRVLGARDTRVVLVDRLAPMLRPKDRVLVVRELAILPDSRASERSLRSCRGTRCGRPRKGVPGTLSCMGGSIREISLRRKEATCAPRCWKLRPGSRACQTSLRIGSAPTPLNPFFFRSNDELLIVARPPEPRGGSVTH